jgi:hypothetical protein
MKYLVHVESRSKYKLVIEADAEHDAIMDAEARVYEDDDCPPPYSENTEAASVTRLPDDDQEAPE